MDTLKKIRRKYLTLVPTNESKEKSLSKVLERIMYNRVYNYLDSKRLRYKKQIGFQRNNST